MRLLKFGAVLSLLFCSSAALAGGNAPLHEAMTADLVVASDGSTVETVHSERRAENDAGAMMASRAALPYNAQMQALEIVEAHTLKKDGTKVPVDLSSIYEQLSKDAGQFATFADMRSKMIQFPQFAAGDTAVFTAKLTTAHPYFPGHFLHGEVFSRTRGNVDITETVTAPRTMTLYSETHDMDFAKRVQGNNVVYAWHHVQDEPKPLVPVVVSAVDREPRFFISTFKDYGALGRAYAALSQPKIAVTEKVKALAEQVTAGQTDRRAQAEKIYAWVSKNIRYVAIELGRGSLEPHDVDSILANGYGDCKDHDLLLQALLKAKGIGAESILINSGNAYSLTSVPSFAQLNHVITHVPEFDVYLDSSFPMAPFGVLPMGEYGKPAVRVSSAKAEQFTMPLLPAGLSTVTANVNAQLDASGRITGTSTTKATGPSSIILRVEALAMESIGPQRAADLQFALRGLKSATGTADLGSPMDLGPDYAISTSISSSGWSDWLSGADRKTLPGAATGLNTEPAIGALYVSMSDTEPTPCYSIHAVEDVSLALPPNVTPELPADASVQTSHIAFSARWQYADGRLTLHRDYQSKFDTALCAGSLRSEVAAALRKISDSYKTQVHLRHAGAAATQSGAAHAELRP
jgi:hypothetical protein